MIKPNKALISGSLVLLVAFNIFNTLNFFFQLVMARMLSAVDYGILATLIAIVSLTTIFSESIQTIIAKYSCREENPGKLKNLINRTAKKSLKISALIFIVYLLAAIPMTFLLNIPYLLITSTGLMIFAAFLPPITRGTMQGKKMFKSLGLNLIAEGAVRLGLGIILVLVGWKVYGAIIATLIAAAVAFVLSLLALRRILKSEDKFMSTRGIYTYSLPVLFILFVILLFYSVDVIIAKIVFPGEIAGYYAIASILGKIIFLGTQPISKAMFPLAVENKKPKDYSLLLNSLGIVFLCILASLAVFYFLPELIVRTFSGRYIPEASAVLFYLGIAFSLTSITNLLLLYKLSSKKMGNYWLFIIFPLIEAVLLFAFSNNLVEFSLALITSSAIFLWGSIFFLED